MITEKNLSFIIVTFKSNKVIHKCIKSINSRFKILVIDNSRDNELKYNLEKKYKNVKCVISKKNLGMGAGNNFGLNIIKKNYVFIINPDVFLKRNTLDEIIKAGRQFKDFSILAPLLMNKKYPNYIIKKNKNISKSTIYPFLVSSVDGFAMLLNLKKIKKILKIRNFNFFDENFFLFLENDDLCKRIINKNEKIYIVPKAKVTHLGAKSVNSKFYNEIEFSRNWHWMWSKFYFNKKHYGYLVALIKVLRNLISSNLKFIYYLFTQNHYKRKIYQMRLLGLISSMMGIRSFYRPKINN